MPLINYPRVGCVCVRFQKGTAVASWGNEAQGCYSPRAEIREQGSKKNSRAREKASWFCLDHIPILITSDHSGGSSL